MTSCAPPVTGKMELDLGLCQAFEMPNICPVALNRISFKRSPLAERGPECHPSIPGLLNRIDGMSSHIFAPSPLPLKADESKD